MKKGLGLLLLFAVPATTAFVPPVDPCACYGCWTGSLNQITCPGTGNPPLIVPTFQTASDNPCDLNSNNQCGVARDPKVCKGSFKVQVTFPSPSCRSSVWVQGGSAFPVATQVNTTTVQSEYTLETASYAL